MPRRNERCVLVTTEHRGVFCGYTRETSGKTIRLRDARLCIYWSADVKGFMGLAFTGPTKSCRIEPPAKIELRGVTSIVEVTAEAEAKWKAQPWSA